MPQTKQKRKLRIGLTTATLLGLGLGIAVGLFFGEPAAMLEPIGNAYINLLQMAVLPYFIVALIYGLGRLSFEEAKMLGIYAAGLLCVLWSLCCVVVVILTFAFPDIEAASFFSTSMIERQKGIDFLSLYIPANPFNSLANAIIPAVVVFGMAVGIALIGINEKQQLLHILSIISDTLTRITQAIVKLTPIGVFALAASAAGTMTFDDLARLQVYLALYATGALVLTFVIVPMLISTLTPFSYREILAASRDAMITGFTTANLLVVLPMLAENCKKLFDREEFKGKQADSSVDVVIPLSFPFPDIGTLLILLFIPFAAWYSGNAMSLEKYPGFLGIGFFSFFGNVEIGMPFLLNQLRIPADMFQLHVMTLVYVGRFATMLAVMHVTAVALVTTCAVNGMAKLNITLLARQVAFSVVLLILAVAGPSLLFKYTVDPEYKGYQAFVEQDHHVQYDPAKVFRKVLPEPFSPQQGTSRLDQIRERGILRVGYFSESLPYVFMNASAKLVGFDAEMAHTLAREMEVKLEFVLIERDRMNEMLDKGYCDIVMSSIHVTTLRLEDITFSASYADETLAFIVKDHLLDDFNSREKVQAMLKPRIGVINAPYLIAKLERYMPQAEIVPIDSVRTFFRGNTDLDVLVFTAESGSAWSLIYPEYSVAIPRPDIVSTPMAYALPYDDLKMKNFIDAWIELKQKDMTIKKLYDYWILGRSSDAKNPRWSIIRDVLHWID